MLREPALITHELARAQMGEWLPQALQARRQTLRDVLAQLERQQARLLDLYLAEVIERAEFERKRQEVTQTHHGLTQQLRQLDARAQQHVNVAEAEAVARARDACVDPGVEAGRLRSLRAAWNRAPAVPDCLRVARVGDHPPSISEAGDEDLDETAIRVTRIVEVYRYIKSVGPVREARHVPGRIETGRVPGEADVA